MSDGKITETITFTFDDAEHKQRFCALLKEFLGLSERAVLAEREACAKIADRCTDDDTRKALGANAVITASQIAAAIRARK